MGRTPCCDKTNVKKGPWSPEEDTKLKDYIHKYGTGGNWIAFPHKAGLKRCGKSCRLRWLNYLRPNIKHGGFSDDEDRIICSLFASIGSRWSIIAGQLPGRTDNDIKNYWNTKLKKKLWGIINNTPNSQNIKTNQQQLFFSSPLTASQDVYNSTSNGSTLYQDPSLNQYRITEQSCSSSEISYGKELDQGYIYAGPEDHDQKLSFLESGDQWEGAPPLLDYACEEINNLMMASPSNFSECNINDLACNGAAFVYNF